MCESSVCLEMIALDNIVLTNNSQTLSRSLLLNSAFISDIIYSYESSQLSTPCPQLLTQVTNFSESVLNMLSDFIVKKDTTNRWRWSLMWIVQSCLSSLHAIFYHEFSTYCKVRTQPKLVSLNKNIILSLSFSVSFQKTLFNSN